ncbi:aldose epimerase family protein [Flavobacterium sp.]|jgi:aldose 1-epimerase|uniref:aldose epimerase family protein n=1 Tax=Flavobacterium sp. TaxID=239 RepID=UPI0037C1336D
MKKQIHLAFLFIVFISFKAISQSNLQNSNSAQLYPKDFNTILNGKQVGLFFLKNGNLTAAITNYGGRIVSLCAPDINGQKADVVLGFKSIDDYLKATGVYHGAIIGRVIGRIAKGIFEMDGKSYSLPINNGANHQHGGLMGFHNQVWEVKFVTQSSIVLSYNSVDGEMGYPGNLKVEATYTLTSNNDLTLKLSATTDKSTIVNLTNHAFFNLAGEGNGTILDHILTIPSHSFCAVNPDKIKTGEILKVEGTPFDFRKGKPIGKDIILDNANEQLKIAGGYDQSYVLKKKHSAKIVLAATVVDPKSGRKLEVFTNNLGVHFFSANFFKGTDIGKMGKPFNFRESFALETQDYNSPNQKSFPTLILKPGQKFESYTIYHFSTTK